MRLDEVGLVVEQALQREMWLIERNVVLPSLLTRSAIKSVMEKIWPARSSRLGGSPWKCRPHTCQWSFLV